MPTDHYFPLDFDQNLYTRLKALFDKWELDEPSFDVVAKLMASQRLSQDQLESAGLDVVIPPRERKHRAHEYLKHLHLARNAWLSMAQEDRESMAVTIFEEMPGHEITTLLNVEHRHAGYAFNEAIADWRKEGLKDLRWKIDTEMLDLLIGMAMLWISNRAPAAYTRVTADQESVNYLAMVWSDEKQNVSPSVNSRFTQLLREYFYKEGQSETQLMRDYRDMIKKAKAYLSSYDSSSE